MNKKYILIDLYTGKSELIPADEVKEATYGLKKKKGATNVWKGEEYIVVEVSKWVFWLLKLLQMVLWNCLLTTRT